MKKLILTFTSIIFSLCLFAGCNSGGDYVKKGFKYQLNEDQQSYTLVSYSGDDLNFVVPHYYEGKPVTKISKDAFKSCSFTRVDLPESIESIGENAFNDKVNSIYFKGNVEDWCNVDIANSMFYDKTLYIDNQLASNIIIPNTVEKIKANVFNGFKNIQSIEVSESVESIDDNAFYYSSLQTITFSENSNLKSIGRDAFSYTNLTNVEFPNNLETIGERAFSSSKLQKVVFKENSKLNSIYKYAFENCKDLEEVELPKSIKIIQDCAFNYCSNLKTVNFANDCMLSTISSKVFKSCYDLQSIVIPSKVVSIENEAFIDCKGLQSVEISESVQSIGEYAFYNCENLKSVNIKEKSELKHIEKSAFRDCKSLESISIPQSVEYIRQSAFSGCANMHTVNFEGYSNITSIENFVFHNCSSLANITIPQRVTNIGKSAFEYCASLRSIEISSNVEVISEKAFYWSGLKTVTYSYGCKLRDIGTQAFDVTNIKEIEIPTTVQFMGETVFYSLKTITYLGSINSWNSISKNANWDSKLENYQVICIDGTISK